MSEKKTIKLTCYGCGAELQNFDASVTGYYPKEMISNEGAMLCQRCFRLQHYGENKKTNTFSPDYAKILKAAQEKKCLIIYVVDLFAFESSLLHQVFPLIQDNPLLIVANKRDVLPREVSNQKLIDFVKERFDQEGLKVSKIIISSAYKNYNIDEIIDAVTELRHKDSVYVVGAASVGKSSLINSFLKVYKNETKNLISTSPYPGTTLDVIKVPLDDKTYFYDTPGLVVDNSIFAHIENPIMKYVIPRREIKPRSFQLNEKQSILIGGIARLDFVKGRRTGFTFYVSNEVDLHRTKLERANEVFRGLISGKKIKPISIYVKGVEELEEFEFTLPENQEVDIMISGYAWIKVHGQGQSIHVLAPRGVDVIVRQCKI